MDNVFVRQNFATNGPSFIANPQSQTNYAFTSTSLFAEALSGQPTINYQWYHVSADGLTTNALLNATNTSFTIVSSSVSDEGYYYLQASDGIGTSESSLAYVHIIPRPGLTTVNGDFEIPNLVPIEGVNGGGGVGVAYWYAPVNSYEAWVKSASTFQSGSQACVFAPDGGGWIYQFLGTYNPTNGTNLNWTFEQVTDIPLEGANNSADFAISFYYTTDATFTPAQGADIDGAAGVTLISSNFFNSLNVAGLTVRTNTGSQNLSGVPSGATIWFRRREPWNRRHW